MKQKIILCLMMLFSVTTYAQRPTELRGNIINSANNEPVTGVSLTLRGQSVSVQTDAQGKFHFVAVAPGDDHLSLVSSGIITQEIPVSLEAGEVTYLRDIKVVVKEAAENMVLLDLVDQSTIEEEGSSQDISSLLIMSNDVYLNKVNYQLSSIRFKVRGYDDIYQEKFINGVNFNDQNRGKFNYASIGALNDITRNGDAVNYQAANSFTYGNIGGSENINMRAGSFARGGKVTLSYTNRNYYARGIASYSTGLMDDGYAFTVALGGRYSDQGNIAGTFYQNVSYAFGMEKQWNGGKHSISFNTFGSPVKRGQQGSSYQEVYDLTGDNLYNPNWGYQNGKKRNSRVVEAFDPTAILSHIWKINKQLTLSTGVGAHYARYGGSALNWYNGADPRPDYYRYLPSYFMEKAEPEMDTYDYYTSRWRSGDKSFTQINWDNMIRQNQNEVKYGDGQAIYMIEERRSDLFEVALNTTINVAMTDNMKLTAGFDAKSSLSKQFKTVKDLLGANYVLDIDKYAERDDNEGAGGDMSQNNLDRPNRKVYKKDKFGYDFRLNINSFNWWIQQQYTTQHVDAYVGAKIGYTEFYRTGRMRNGRYKNESMGEGKTHDFVDFGMKGGLTYKINGRHYITGNLSFATEAPLPYDAYTSPRISDRTVDLESSKILAADINYIFSMPSFNGRVTLFQSYFWNTMTKKSYYHDAERTFVNHVLTGMNKINRGIELAGSYRINDHWSVDAIGTVAEYYYSNNPNGVVSYENGVQELEPEKVYLKDNYVGGTPQVAGSFGINYFNNYWFLNLNVNGFARNYIDMASLRRISSNYSGVDPNNPEQMEGYRKLMHQERFGSGYTLDFSIGKMIYLRNRQAVNFNLAFNNILDRKNVRTGGYEQARNDVAFTGKFGNKYFYMQGFNCFLNASYRF